MPKELSIFSAANIDSRHATETELSSLINVAFGVLSSRESEAIQSVLSQKDVSKKSMVEIRVTL